MELIYWHGFSARADNIPIEKAGVYRFTCLANGKSYVGISQNVAFRCKGHGENSPKKFRNAIHKHGRHNFLCEPLFYWTCGELERLFLLGIEAELIAAHDSVRNGYNLQEKSESGSYGPKFRAIMSEAMQRRAKDPQYAARCREIIKEVTSRPSWKTNHAAAMATMAEDEEFLRGARERGKLHSQDPVFLAKIREAGQRFANDPAFIAATTAANRLKAQDPDWLAATTAANRRKAQDPEWLEATRAGTERRSQNGTWRENQRAGHGRWRNSPEGQAAILTGQQTRRDNPNLGAILKSGWGKRRERGNIKPNRGAKNGHSKLTEEIVRAIRAAAGKEPLRVTAARFGINYSYACDIQKRRSWAWLE